MTLTLHCAGRTDVGRKRDYNEDDFVIDLDTGLMTLADGMGGHAAGEVASRLAVGTVTEFIRRSAGGSGNDWPYGFDERLSLSANRLRAAVRLANEKIFRTIEENEELRGMGTTLVAALGRNGSVCVAHVGDSRAYSARADRLEQVTSDHSWVNEQVLLGLLTREEASRHPFRNVITRALGSREEIVPDIAEIAMSPGDRLVLCSDGLTTMLDDGQILEILRRHPRDDEAAASELIARANAAGGEDNITVIVAGFSA